MGVPPGPTRQFPWDSRGSPQPQYTGEWGGSPVATSRGGGEEGEIAVGGIPPLLPRPFRLRRGAPPASTLPGRLPLGTPLASPLPGRLPLGTLPPSLVDCRWRHPPNMP